MEAQLFLSVAGLMGKDLKDKDFLKAAFIGFRLVDWPLLILNVQGMFELEIAVDVKISDV